MYFTITFMNELTNLKKKLFGLRFNVPGNSYGHLEWVSSPNHVFSWASLTKQLTITLCVTTTLLESEEEENDCRKYFMIKRLFKTYVIILDCYHGCSKMCKI